MSIQTSASITALSKALLTFQGKTSGVKRDAANPHFKSRYASLENVIDYARGPLQEVGIVFSQAPGSMVDGSLEVTTRLTHAETGEWQQSTMHIPLSKKDPQGAGSALTYGMRYSLMAALGLPPTDDDAEEAYDRGNQRQQPQDREQPARKTVANDAPSLERQIEIADSLIGAMEFSRSVDDLKVWKKDEAKTILMLGTEQMERVGKAFKAREAKLHDAATNYLEAGE